MTFWDFLCWFWEKGGLAWTLLLLAAVGFVWVLGHPEKVKEWNVMFSVWKAGFVPKKRKRAFEKKLKFTIETTKDRFSKAAPAFMSRFLPYDLKVEWVDENDTMESVVDEKQIIVYVPSYMDEIKQVVGVLHNYCVTGFAQKAKIYMPNNAQKASDILITQKLAQHAGYNVFDYFNRYYLSELQSRDEACARVLDQLKKVDVDGLFLPVLLNEIDKYANSIYPTEPSPETMDTVMRFMNFIYRIATRERGEIVPLVFCEDQIKVKIILAVSDMDFDTERPEKDADNAIQAHSVNTIYVLATGRKMAYAREIAEGIYKRNAMDVYDPVETEYKRFTRRPQGADSICFEINVR